VKLVLLVFVLASLNSNGDTAHFGLVPFLAGRARCRSSGPTASTEAIIRLGIVLGPILGGFLSAALGAANVLFAPTVTYMISVLLIGIGCRRPPTAPARPKWRAGAATRPSSVRG
jgi:predicted MFS family arabinose efflux permease